MGDKIMRENAKLQKEVKTRISYIVDALGKMEEVLKRQAELDDRRSVSKKESETAVTGSTVTHRRIRKISGSESGSPEHKRAARATSAVSATTDKAEKQRDSSSAKQPRKKKPRKDSSSGEDSDDGAATKSSKSKKKRSKKKSKKKKS